MDIYFHSILILISILFLWGWNLPNESRLRVFWLKASKWVYFWGLSHNWSMFAPTPFSGSRKIEFELIEKSGASTRFSLPFLCDHSKIFSSIECKLLINLSSKDNDILKESFCRYILQEYRKQFPAKACHFVQINIISLNQRYSSTPSELYKNPNDYKASISFQHKISSFNS